MTQALSPTLSRVPRARENNVMFHRVPRAMENSGLPWARDHNVPFSQPRRQAGEGWGEGKDKENA